MADEEKKTKKPKAATKKATEKKAKAPKAAPKTKKEPKVEIVEATPEVKKKPTKAKGKKKAPKHEAKAKPKLGDDTKDAMKKRAGESKSRPKFRRQEWFRYKKLGTSWRKPRGLHSKARRGIKRRTNIVSIGYGGPSGARGLHPSGFEEVLVYNVKQMWNIKPETQAVRIGATVGAKKRLDIIQYANEKGIRVLNRNSVKVDRAVTRIEEKRGEE